MNALEHILCPVSAPTFFDEFWGKKPLYVERNRPGHFNGITSTSEIEWMLRNCSPRYPVLRLVDPRIPNMSALLQDAGWGTASRTEPDMSFLYKRYEQGATVTIQDMQTRSEPIAKLCTELSGDLQQSTNANIYMTPPHAQGFGAHFDKHDVIVIQLEGCKLWKLHTPSYLLPTEEHYMSGARPDLDGTMPDQEFLLSAGDTLYLPRGWIHAAATNDAPSLHITIGVHVVRWRDLLIDMLLDSAEHNLELREALMLDCSRMAELTQQAMARWRRVIAEDLTESGIQEALKRRRERSIQKSRALPGTQFTSLNHLTSADGETRFKRRAYSESSLKEDIDTVTLTFSGGTLTCPLKAKEVIEFVAHCEEIFTAAEIPSPLTVESRLVLLKRFVKEGLLQIVEPQKAYVEPNNALWSREA